MIDLLDRLLAAAAGRVGLPLDALKTIVCLLLAYPLAGLLKRIPDDQPRLRNLFCIACGLFFLVGVFDLWTGLVHILVSSLVTYTLAGFWHSPLMPWVNFVFIMGHMSYNQVARQWANDPDAVDITGAQMVLVMKLTAFAWNIMDGKKKDLADFQKENALTHLPALDAYLAWVFFFPAMLIGPAFEFAQYEKWLSLQLFEPPAQIKAAPRFRKGRKIPRSGRPALRRALEGLFWLGVFSWLSTRFSVQDVLSDRFGRTSWLYRFWYIMPLALTHRTKYYGVWKLSEGSCILAGFGFSYKDGKQDWSSIENISPYEFETSQNTKALLEAWNKNTNKWLKQYVYLRVTPQGKRPGFLSTLATFLTSAIWHGFYPGYYLAFMLGAFAQTMGKYYRRNLRPFFLQDDLKTPTANKWMYDVVCWAVTQWSWAYIVQSFVVLSFKDSLKFDLRYGFYVHVGMLLTVAFFKSPAGALVKRQVRQRQQLLEKSSKETSKVGRDPELKVDVLSDQLTEEVQALKKDLDEQVLGKRRPVAT
ncbi:MBOAT, membrane-bound O-acyltransferase family-domain-containing protein [Protomyces lactucae-debilis]|uniref:MBOAT, membrane-bound O-acyltransferase family-domain-containing protein n=1 Tax=Protomyces lactucae-debilis TaxID=2754530 RepID=A0A1Y2EU61_PROLT|nr:MBOAT, membrane-bound O-acyltransferase family-domain-containing protein [Protomyces lactucae-debilis]ORY75100.1 MBOAT, membrane-bound O-acyltransferase family-domain-containing protein [Protomyces lactucae-debilis]